MNIQPDAIVGDLVASHPELGSVFEQLGIDYCCGGRKSLSVACEERQLNIEDTIAKLKVPAINNASAGELNPVEMTLSDLIDNIISTHHEYLRKTLPQLSVLVEKVAQKHGERNEQLLSLPSIMDGFVAEIMSHMMKEENMLFPAIRRLEQSSAPIAMPFGSIANPIGVMESEHENASRALEQFRNLTGDYSVPEWGCNSYRSMVHELAELEMDLHQHIHKENNILFPRAIALESAL